MMKKIQTLCAILTILITAIHADGLSTRGELLFKQCAGCHGVNGKNKAFGKSGILAGQSATAIAESLKTYKEDGSKNAAMTKQAKSLNAQDIASVSEYIAKLKK